MRLLLALLLLSLAAGAPVVAQAPASAAGDAPNARPEADEARTEAEQAVAEIIAGDGVHVVHFWAPWCGNAIAELRAGWYETVERHPDVSFTFVSIWDDGNDGADVLARYGIPDRVTVLAQPDLGPSEDRANRRRQFLGLPVTWSPTTWVFHSNGELAVAFNYGEVSPEQVTEAIELAQADW